MAISYTMAEKWAKNSALYLSIPRGIQHSKFNSSKVDFRSSWKSVAMAQTKLAHSRSREK